MSKSVIILIMGLVMMVATSVTATVHIINIGDFFFSPTGTVIYPGDTVRWTLQSGSHTTTSDSSSTKHWDSGPMNTPGQTFDVVFTYEDGPGPFPYHCEFHPATMADTIFTGELCFASGDINNNGDPLEVSDLILLLRLINGDSLPVSIDNLYEADLNGDCVIDGGDAELFNCFLTYGMSCFTEYPVPTCCYPDTVTGACCVDGDSCSIRSEENCIALGGEYFGDGTKCDQVEEYCCCSGIRGNVDYDPDDEVNVADLTALVDYLFLGDFLPCWEEGNVDGLTGSGGIGTDVRDLTYLVEYLFQGGPPPPSCTQ